MDWLTPTLKLFKWLIVWMTKGKGLQLHTPATGVAVKRGDVNVRGTFKKQPKGHWWLFIRDGFEYWPQHEAQFDTVNNNWVGDIHLGMNLGSTVTIMLVMVSEDLHLLAEYYGRVHTETDKYISVVMSKEPTTFTVLASIDVPLT
jgi:hypothetical protein